MNKNKAILAVVVVVIVAIAGLFFRSPQAPDEFTPETTAAKKPQKKSRPIEVGILAPLQGTYSREGNSIAQGAKLAEILINESGGISGRPLRLRTLDTRSNPQITSDLTKELIQKGTITAIIGTVSEESSVAAIDTLRGKKIPFFYVNNGLVKTCQNTDVLKVSDFVWGLGLTPHMKTEPFLIYMADKLRQPESNFSIYYFGNETEKNIQETDYVIEIADSLGFQNNGEDFVDLRIADLFQRVRKIFGANPDLLYISTAQSGTPRFMQQAAKLGISSEMAIAGIDSFNEETIRDIAESAENLQTVVRYSHLLKNEKNKVFLEKWKEHFPKSNPPTALAASGGYSSVMILKAAIEKAKDTSFEAIKKAMNNLEIELPQGKVAVSDYNHLLVQPLYASRIKDGQIIIEEFLGDVSHPALESCAIVQLTEEQEEEQEERQNEERQNKDQN